MTARFLLSMSGDLLCFDARTGAVCRAPLCEAPRNLALVGHDAPWDDQPASVSGRLCPVTRDGAATGVGISATWRLLSDRSIALAFGDAAAGAGEADAAEGYWPLSHAQIDGLAFIMQHRWLSDSLSDQDAVPSAARFHDDGIEISGVCYALETFLGSDDALLGVIERKSFSIIHDGWRIARFRLYKPLIYYTAFGSGTTFDCLELAVRSLAELGGWHDRIMVVTDTANLNFASRFAAPLQAQIQTRITDGRDVLDYTLARYKIRLDDDLTQYQPVLYLDTDVICDEPIEPTMVALLRSPPLVHFCAEHALTCNPHWYGARLLLEDGYRPRPEERGFSTGIIGFRSFRDVLEPFAKIVASCEAHALACGDRNSFDTYDQPFANYVFRKLGGFDTAVLSRITALPGLPAEIAGFTHFAGGVSNSTSKLKRMQDYMASRSAAAT